MQGRQQGGGNSDNSMDFLWAGVGIIGLVLGIWILGRTYIIQFIYLVKYYEASAIVVVLDGWNALAHKISLLPGINPAPLKLFQQQAQTKHLAMTYDAMEAALALVGRYLSYPMAFILAILAFIVHGKNITMKLKNIFNMKTMKEAEKVENPQITPVVKLNLVKEHVNEGPWAMSLTPMQFCKQNNLLKEKKVEGAPVTVEVVRGDAQQLFVMQLGPMWTGVDSLPLHAKALFAAFAACGNQDRSSGVKLLQHIAASAGEGQINFDGAQELLAKHKNSKLVAKVISRHAYVLTVFSTMLELARTDGVFSSSEFLWLKPLNRRLWYVLNTVGRQTAVPEVGGVYAHWIAEKKWGGPLRTPMVEEAVKALEVALSEVIYEPGEEE